LVMTLRLVVRPEQLVGQVADQAAQAGQAAPPVDQAEFVVAAAGRDGLVVLVICALGHLHG
jgi:hypothetical protein